MGLQTILDDVKMLDTVSNAYSDNPTIFKSFRKVQTELLRLAQRQMNPKPVKPPKLQDGLTPGEAELARKKDGKIAAIKAVRQRRVDEGQPYDLRVAKDIVENWMQKHLGFMCWPPILKTNPVPARCDNYDDPYNQDD